MFLFPSMREGKRNKKQEKGMRADSSHVAPMTFSQAGHFAYF